MSPVLLLLSACSDYGYTPDKAPEDAGENCADAAPDAPGVVVDDACLREPEVGTFHPVVEWQWSVNPVNPDYAQIMSTPAVANLTDDDGDGDVDADDVPDVVFTTFTGSAYTSAGALVAISGDGSGTLWSVMTPGGEAVYASGSPAIGDLDGDGFPEVCTAGVSHAVVCVDRAGALVWASGAEISYVGAPALADLDRDGKAEVVFGRQIFNHTGKRVGLGTAGLGLAAMSFPVDMDGDGDLEVVVGNAVYERDGTTLWTNGLGDGMPAVGDFDADGRPDVVSVYGGVVSLAGNDGTVLWQTAVPGGGSGGPPTVADFDGDGAPEIGVAGLSLYSMIDTDGTVIWSREVSDYSSSVTGSSVFDFEADGAAEVVYADEHTLWVFDGATGAVKMQEDGHASGTLFEYPLIADVDHDGTTEIVVASNNYAYTGWNGITVLGDADASWAESRPVWNEFAYHITNVEDDGGIPTEESPNWTSWNNFRAGGIELGPAHWLADLAVDGFDVCTDDCTLGEAEVYVIVSNAGLLDGRDVVVELRAADGSVALTTTLPEVTSGESAVLGPWSLDAATWGSGVLTAWIDPDDAVPECDVTDNRADLGTWPCG